MTELINIITELKAQKNLENKFGGFKYRNAEGILESLKPLLKKYECYVTMDSQVQFVGERYYISTTATIVNKEGKSECASAIAREADSKKGMDDAQVTGSSISYSKKYALCNLFCIDDSSLDPDAINDIPAQEPQVKAPTSTETATNITDAKSKGNHVTDEEICSQLTQCNSREEANQLFKQYRFDITKEPFKSAYAQLKVKFQNQ